MGKIKVTDNCNGIAGLKVIEPPVFGDARGYFMETYNYNDFKEAGIDCEFVQDNQSASKKGVLRGLHFQINYPQDKLVRVVNGEVYDVAVDLREGSETFGKWFGVTLSAENKKQFFIPKGFAHGFIVLSDYAEFCYKVTEKTGYLIGAKLVSDGREIMLITTEGIVIRMFVDDISVIGRNTSGVKLMNIDQDSDIKVASIAKVRESATRDNEAEEENLEEAEADITEAEENDTEE